MCNFSFARYNLTNFIKMLDIPRISIYIRVTLLNISTRYIKKIYLKTNCEMLFEPRLSIIFSEVIVCEIFLVLFDWEREQNNDSIRLNIFFITFAFVKILITWICIIIFLIRHFFHPVFSLLHKSHFSFIAAISNYFQHGNVRSSLSFVARLFRDMNRGAYDERLYFHHTARV